VVKTSDVLLSDFRETLLLVLLPSWKNIYLVNCVWYILQIIYSEFLEFWMPVFLLPSP